MQIDQCVLAHMQTAVANIGLFCYSLVWLRIRKRSGLPERRLISAARPLPSVSSNSLPRLIFINRYFHPDQSATSRLLSDLAFALADAEHDILILTSQQRYDDPNARLPASEVRGRVSIQRFAGTRFGRMKLLGRLLDYLTFYLLMAVRLLRVAHPGDTIVSLTDPPMLSIVAGPIASRKGCRIVNWLQDLYPEVAVAVGTPFLKPTLVKFIATFRDRSLRAADCNVVIATAMAERVQTLGVKKDHIQVIPNWVDDRALVPVPAHQNPLRRAWGLEDKFVVSYSGNLGERTT